MSAPLTDREQGYALAADVALDACEHLPFRQQRLAAHKGVACALALNALAIDGVSRTGLARVLRAAYEAGPRPERSAA